MRYDDKHLLFVELNEKELQKELEEQAKLTSAYAHLFEQLNAISHDLLRSIFRWISFRDRSAMAVVSKQFLKLKYSAGVPNHVDINWKRPATYLANSPDMTASSDANVIQVSDYKTHLSVAGDVNCVDLNGGVFYNDICVNIPIYLDYKTLERVKSTAEYVNGAVELGICVQGAVGANDASVGAWHVGFTIGRDQWCFHPGFSSPMGASRLQI
ncbi:hypothetical protein RFI_29788, partial [Reticulomyxa filosa]